MKNNFEKWLDTFIDEKGIDIDDIFTIEGYDDVLFDYAYIIDAIKATSPEEQYQIKNMIVRIDFLNGDILAYFRHLAKALI